MIRGRLRFAWLVVKLAGLLIGVLASSIRPWQAAELRLFDFWSVHTAPRQSSLPITIVGVDEASFVQINQRWPWPRDLHARLIDRLRASGAAVIAFDMIFSEKASAEEDAALAAAVQRAGNVVLAADHAYRETAFSRQWLRVDPLPELTFAGALSGLATVSIDSDAVIRRFPESEDIFWRSAIKVLQRSHTEISGVGAVPANAMIRHLGPARTFPYVPYYKVLDTQQPLPPDFFRDQIVLIGRDVRASPEVGSAQSDVFATPFLGESQLLTPGVEIHATLIENALTGRILVPSERRWTLLVLVAAVLLAVPALQRWHPFWSGAWMLCLGAAVLSLSWWMFDVHSVWLPVLSVLLALAAQYLGMGLLSYLIEKRRASEIKRTFSKYVAPQVVEQMVANPALVRLGGERRELTLLFTDLAGFTTLSEKLSPEDVAQVINLYLTEMTRIVMTHGGTVDKFIGDALMAFWGAPLDDGAHAQHAAEAAIEMQQVMSRLQPQFEALGAPEVALRIGLHTGPAIVGNMGSVDRFDYTALGDAVNLASRLEGVNKTYGTKVLLSAATAAGLPPELGLREVDRVRVKGKNEPIEILTPCTDPRLIELTRAATVAYRMAHWIEAKEAWLAVAQAYPGDTVARVFLARLEAFLQQPPTQWDGSVSLEKG